MRGRGVVKAATRWVGVATARWRPLPDFLVIGAKRGGSTSLYFSLLEHPGILPLFPPPVPVLKGTATKGVHYFDSHFDRGEQWYRSYFPTAGTRKLRASRLGYDVIAGEASPYYLFHPAAASRARQVAPEARIIVLLRDPVQRTYSHWKERRREGVESLDFIAALDAEPQRLFDEERRILADPGYRSYAHEQQSYATQSHYAPALRRWYDEFGHERIWVGASEEFYDDPLPVLQSLDRFLDLPPRQTAASVVRNSAAGDPLDSLVSAELRSGFAPGVAELSELTRRKFPWTQTGACDGGQ